MQQYLLNRCIRSRNEAWSGFTCRTHPKPRAQESKLLITLPDRLKVHIVRRTRRCALDKFRLITVPSITDTQHLLRVFCKGHSDIVNAVVAKEEKGEVTAWRNESAQTYKNPMQPARHHYSHPRAASLNEQHSH